MKDSNFVKEIIHKQYKSLLIFTIIIFPLIGLTIGSTIGVLVYLIVDSVKDSMLDSIKFNGAIFGLFTFVLGIKNFISEHNKIQKFKKLPLEEQLKKIEAIEAQKALRKSQKRKAR